MFLQGLRDGGVPIKFSSWHTFIFSSQSATNVQLLIQERSRSVKAIFTVQRRAQPLLNRDSHALLYDTALLTWSVSGSAIASNSSSTLQSYQYRVGGRYFPAAPVQTSSSVGSAISNGACEAYVELSKALNIVGDYRLSTNCNVSKWGLQSGIYVTGSNSGAMLLQEYDYTTSLNGFTAAGNGTPNTGPVVSSANAFGGTLASACFAMATNFETSNGIEISGLNAEEQSDISLIANWSSAQVTGDYVTPSNLEAYTFYDAMLILRENNVLELIQ